MLKPICTLSLLAAMTLVTTPTAALAGQNQASSQQAGANAIARGRNARAVNNIHQNVYQIYYGYPGDWGYGYGYSDPQVQVSSQQGTANAIATGDNSTAISNLNQANQQNYYSSPDYWGYPNYGYGGYGGYPGYGYEADPQVQSAQQQGTANAIATGDNSTAVSNVGQYTDQTYFGYPGYWGY